MPNGLRSRSAASLLLSSKPPPWDCVLNVKERQVVVVEVQLELVVQGTAPSRPAVPEEAVSRALALHVVVVMEVQVELGLHNRSASARVP